MNEISHLQARRFIREELDRPVPGEQWSALEAHLEHCAACRAFRDQRLEIGRSLRRTMQGRWETITTGNDLAAALSAQIARQRKTRPRRMKIFQAVFPVLLLIAVLTGYLVYLKTLSPAGLSKSFGNAPAPGLTQTSGGPLNSTPLPSEVPLVNQPVSVAFEAAPGGIRDIYLLSPGPSGMELTNLTGGIGNNSDPAWSPDGRWIAFLSDRDRPGGMKDVYVISIAGTRLTRLTADPQITWKGPLSWSPDGRWIAVEGSRRDTPLSWIYRVSWDGNFPQPVAYSRGGSFPKFSPVQPQLAYLQEDKGIVFIRIYDDRSGITRDLTREEAARGQSSGVGGAFDWSWDGKELLYVVSGDGSKSVFGLSQIYAKGGLDRLLDGPQVVSRERTQDTELARFTGGARLVGAGWSAFGDLILALKASDPNNEDDCRQLLQPDVSLKNFLLPRPANRLDLPQFCLAGGFDYRAWTADGQRLLLAGRSKAGETTGIYSFSFADAAESPRTVSVTRLADLPESAVALMMRPDSKRDDLPGPVQQIDPRPAPEPAAAPPPVIPPADLLGRALIIREDTGGSTIARLNADGSGITPLEGSRNGFCVQRSPDGDRIAFVSFGQGDDTGRSDIYVMPAVGKNAVKLTKAQDFPDPQNANLRHQASANYDCPVWSPDGTRLAAWVDAGGQTYIAIIPAGGSVPGAGAHYFPLIPSGIRVRPRWSRDSRRIYLFIQEKDQRYPSIAMMEAASGTLVRLGVSDGWDTVGDAMLSPAGEDLSYITLKFTASYETQTALVFTSTLNGKVDRLVGLPAYSTLMPVNGYGALTWLTLQRADSPGNPIERLGLAFRGSPNGRLRSSLQIYDILHDRLVPLIVLDEELYSAGWSPDGNWVLYSTDSGIWALNISGMLDGTASPAWLSPERAIEIDWR